VLPSSEKLKPPNKGHCGILASFQAKPVATNLQPILPPLPVKQPVTDRNCSVNLTQDVDETEADRHENAFGDFGSPRSCQTDRSQEHGVLEVKRALRSLWPGDWDASVFKELQARALDEGKWTWSACLSDIAVKASRSALDAGSYQLCSKSEKIQLPPFPRQKWFGVDSTLQYTPSPGGFKLPLICAAMGPLEVAAQLRRHRSRNPIVITFDITDFSPKDGSICGVLDCRSMAQRDMMMRTTLEKHLRVAEIQCSCGLFGSADHTRATIDPYIIVTEGVRMFRGPREEGYPFLDDEESRDFSVMCFGRYQQRPELGRQGETFAIESDALAYMDRLDLCTLAAINALQHSPELPANSKPIMIISAHDMSALGRKQPRHSIAGALRSWRSLYAGAFEAVIVACGDEKTAKMMDSKINHEVYHDQSVKDQVLNEWHWSTTLLKLSANPALLRMGQALKITRNLHGAKGGEKDFGKKRKSSSSGTDHKLIVLDEVKKNPQHQVHRDAIARPNSPKSTSVFRSRSSVQMCIASLSRRGSDNLTPANSDGTASSNVTPAQAKASDSRSVFERSLQRRLWTDNGGQTTRTGDSKVQGARSSTNPHPTPLVSHEDPGFLHMAASEPPAIDSSAEPSKEVTDEINKLASKFKQFQEAKLALVDTAALKQKRLQAGKQNLDFTIKLPEVAPPPAKEEAEKPQQFETMVRTKLSIRVASVMAMKHNVKKEIPPPLGPKDLPF